MREEYFGPVGFAKEPAEERKRWILRAITILFIVFILWLAYTRVFKEPTDHPGLGPSKQQTLPGPQ